MKCQNVHRKPPSRLSLSFLNCCSLRPHPPRIQYAVPTTVLSLLPDLSLPCTVPSHHLRTRSFSKPKPSRPSLSSDHLFAAYSNNLVVSQLRRRPSKAESGQPCVLGNFLSSLRHRLRLGREKENVAVRSMEGTARLGRRELVIDLRPNVGKTYAEECEYA